MQSAQRSSSKVPKRNHYWGIALTSVAVVVLFYIVTFVGWDFGDQVTGDVIQPHHAFSSVEQLCFYTSRFLTTPLRWMHLRDPLLGTTVLFVLLVGWGLLVYALLAGLLYLLRVLFPSRQAGARG